MRRWHWAALVICLTATAVVFVQSRKLRDTGTPPKPTPEPEPVPAISTTAEPAELHEQTRELARLRNEAMQLRAQKTELEAARHENTQLAQAKKANTSVARRESPPGFVGKEKLTNAGYATPEDAVQTFFWAMCEGDFNMVIASISPASKERQRIEQMTPEQREKLRLKMQAGRTEFVDSISDIGVRDKEIISDDSVALHVGSSLTTNTVRMRFNRTAEGWKLNEPGF